MVSDRQASVHQSLQRRRCDVGCRCASRSSSCRAYSPRLKSAAPKCCDSPSRVSTPRPSFPLLFAQSNFSVSRELPPGQERAVADCVLQLWEPLRQVAATALAATALGQLIGAAGCCQSPAPPAQLITSWESIRLRVHIECHGITVR